MPESIDQDLIHHIDGIIDHALNLPPAERETYIETACQGKEQLRPMVDSMLSKALEVLDSKTAAAEAAAFDAQALGRALAAAVTEQDYLGQRLGPYQLKALAGQGGMGQVYQAFRDDGYFEQQVAVKVLPEITRLMAADASERFGREMQLMGQLKHPHIAQIFDAGVDQQGTAYLVMEWVNGPTITEWCERQSLDVKQRIALWLQALCAVNSAHQGLIIHRDLKPANVLVDEEAGVKVLDFGIAQSLGETSSAVADQEAVQYTQWFSRQYASPEQLDQRDLTTASDQYQLGLLLYELLAGAPLHHEARVLESAAIEALRQQAKTRGIPGWQEIDKDLCCILSRLLNADSNQRYAGLDAVASDIEAWLHYFPISMRKQQRVYVAQRFIRRHWLSVSVVCGLVFLMAAFSVFSLQQAEQIRQEQERTLTELQRSEAMLQFLYETFDYTDPYDTDGGSKTVGEVLERGIEQADVRFANDESIRGRLLYRMGIALSHWGESERALPALLAAANTLSQLDSPPQEDLAVAYGSIGRTYLYMDQLDQAEGWIQKAIDTAAQVSTARALDQQAISYNDLGRLYDLEGKHDDQKNAYETALALDEPGPFHVTPGTRALTLHNLAVAHSDHNIRLEMEREVLAIRLENFGEEHPTVLHTRMVLATLEGLAGNVLAGIAQFEQALPLQQRFLGDDHRDRAIQLTNYARQLIRAGQFDKAVMAASEAQRINTLHRTEDSLYTIVARVVLAQAQLMAGDISSARETTLAFIQQVSQEGTSGFRYCLSGHDLMALTALGQQNVNEAKSHMSHCDLAFYESTTKALPYLAEHEQLHSFLELYDGQPVAALARLDDFSQRHPGDIPTATYAGSNVNDEVPADFIDWISSERQLIRGLSLTLNQRPVPAEQALHQAFEDLRLVLGDDHWKVKLYEPLVAQALLAEHQGSS